MVSIPTPKDIIEYLLTLYRMVMPIGTPFLKEKINNQSMIKMPNIYIFGKLRI